MQISLVIPAYNEEHYIGECLDSVLKNAGGRLFEIIVVDNASTDRTAEVAASRPGVRVVYEKQKGLPSARECGRLAAQGDTVAYIDADTQLPEQWLDTALRIFAEHPEAVALSGPPRYFDATRWQKSVMYVVWWISAPLMYRLVGYMILGTHFIVKKSALDAVGGFNRDIMFYGEDTDIARRLSTQGKVLFRMDFFIYASVRRFASEGMFKTNLTYSLNFLWPVLFGRPFTKAHQDIRIVK